MTDSPEKPFHEMMDEPLSQGVSKCSNPTCKNTAYVRLANDEKYCMNCLGGGVSDLCASQKNA